MKMRLGLELSAPGMQDTGTTREIGPEEPLGLGEPFKGFGRGFAHGLVREAWTRADDGTQGFRNGEGAEAMRPGKLFLQMVGEPLRGCRLRALGTVAGATGVIDAVCFPTAWALIEAMPIMAAAAVLAGADDLAVRGEGGRALPVFWCQGGADIAEGGHGRSPCLRALRRS
jgi:hypothetical protein